MNPEDFEQIPKFAILAKKKSREWREEHQAIKLMCKNWLICVGPSLYEDESDEPLYKLYNIESGVLEFESRVFSGCVGAAIAFDNAARTMGAEITKYEQEHAEKGT